MKQQLINFYLDYSNNYLTVTKMAEDYGITYTECSQLIEIGRKYHHEGVIEKQPNLDEQPKSIDSYIREKHGDSPTYKEFFDTYLDKFREQHPNSTAPRNHMIETFFDNYMKEKV